MASVNTNAAAITALRTLQQTNTSLDKTQNVISTGYKIGEAKDNAAYWAISTTLKSDNKSLSTVKDALGLGASTVDTAYQGLNKAKDVLDEIKSKLTAATQDGVDRDTIQNEIKQLQDQLKSIATSSVFSGENWLSTDTSAVSYNANKSVVASFSRDASGAVSIGKIDVDISKVALFDGSTAANTGGIIDGAVNLKKDGRDLTIGGTDVTTGNTGTAGIASAKQSGLVASSPVAATTLGATASASTTKYSTGLGIAITGTYAAGDTVVINFSGGATGTITAATANLTELNSGTLTWATAATATLSSTPGFALSNSSGLVITNSANSSTAAPTITSVTHTISSATTTEAATPSVTTTTTGTATATNAVVKSSVGLSDSDFAVGDKVSLVLNVNSTPTTYTTAALTAATVADVVAKLNATSGFSTAATASVGTGADIGKLVITAAATGAKSAFSVNSLTAVDIGGTAKSFTGAVSATATAANASTGAFSAVTLDNDDHLYFNIQVDGATSSSLVTIDKALINKTLSAGAATPVTSGTIANVADFKKVVDAALAVSNITGVTTAVGGISSDRLVFTSATTGANSAVVVSDVAASQGGDKISLENMDISATGLAKVGATTSTQIKQVLTAYIDAVNTAITKVTSAAASLGSVASRIDLQKSFVDTLMDTIDKGVGNLIDADMSEESTKLQALQVKQQLGVQALSIANQASQSILSLFRS